MGDGFGRVATKRPWLVGALAALTLAASACDFWNEPRDDDVLRVSYLEDAIARERASGSVDVRVVDAIVTLEAEPGAEVGGVLSLGVEERGVQIVGALDGLEPEREHAVVVREERSCEELGAEPPLFDPEALDLDELRADDEGEASLKRVVTGATLGDDGPRDLAGRAVVIERGEGGPGARLACGVVRLAPHG